jgi:hypothetical protein
MTHQGRLSDQRFDDLRRQGLIKRSGRIYTLTDSGRAHLGMPIEPKSTSGAARAKLAKATKATQAVIPGDLHSTLQSRTVADLRKIAYDTNFDLPGGMTKAGIVRYLVTTAQEHDARLGHTAGDPSYYRLLAAAQARR